MNKYFIEYIKRVMVEPKKNSWNYVLNQDFKYIDADSEEEALDILESMYSVKEVLEIKQVN
jgi:ribosomal protein S7